MAPDSHYSAPDPIASRRAAMSLNSRPCSAAELWPPTTLNFLPKSDAALARQRPPRVCASPLPAAEAGEEAEGSASLPRDFRPCPFELSPPRSSAEERGRPLHFHGEGAAQHVRTPLPEEDFRRKEHTQPPAPWLAQGRPFESGAEPNLFAGRATAEWTPSPSLSPSPPPVVSRVASARLGRPAPPTHPNPRPKLGRAHTATASSAALVGEGWPAGAEAAAFALAPGGLLRSSCPPGQPLRLNEGNSRRGTEQVRIWSAGAEASGALEAPMPRSIRRQPSLPAVQSLSSSMPAVRATGCAALTRTDPQAFPGLLGAQCAQQTFSTAEREQLFSTAATLKCMEGPPSTLMRVAESVPPNENQWGHSCSPPLEGHPRQVSPEDGTGKPKGSVRFRPPPSSNAAGRALLAPGAFFFAGPAAGMPPVEIPDSAAVGASSLSKETYRHPGDTTRNLSLPMRTSRPTLQVLKAPAGIEEDTHPTGIVCRSKTLNPSSERATMGQASEAGNPRSRAITGNLHTARFKDMAPLPLQIESGRPEVLFFEVSPRTGNCSLSIVPSPGSPLNVPRPSSANGISDRPRRAKAANKKQLGSDWAIGSCGEPQAAANCKLAGANHKPTSAVQRKATSRKSWSQGNIEVPEHHECWAQETSYTCPTVTTSCRGQQTPDGGKKQLSQVWPWKSTGAKVDTSKLKRLSKSPVVYEGEESTTRQGERSATVKSPRKKALQSSSLHQGVVQQAAKEIPHASQKLSHKALGSVTLMRSTSRRSQSCHDSPGTPPWKHLQVQMLPSSPDSSSSPIKSCLKLSPCSPGASILQDLRPADVRSVQQSPRKVSFSNGIEVRRYIKDCC